MPGNFYSLDEIHAERRCLQMTSWWSKQKMRMAKKGWALGSLVHTVRRRWSNSKLKWEWVILIECGKKGLGSSGHWGPGAYCSVSAADQIPRKLRHWILVHYPASSYHPTMVMLMTLMMLMMLIMMTMFMKRRVTRSLCTTLCHPIQQDQPCWCWWRGFWILSLGRGKLQFCCNYVLFHGTLLFTQVVVSGSCLRIISCNCCKPQPYILCICRTYLKLFANMVWLSPILEFLNPLFKPPKHSSPPLPPPPLLLSVRWHKGTAMTSAI